MVTDQQVRKLRMLVQAEKTRATAAAKAGMDEKTARKYLKSGQLPSQRRKEHTWRTRPDPFEQEWEEIKEKLDVLIHVWKQKRCLRHFRESNPANFLMASFIRCSVE